MKIFNWGRLHYILTHDLVEGSAKLRRTGIHIIGLCCFLRMTGEWIPAGGGGPTAKQCGAIHLSSSVFGVVRPMLSCITAAAFCPFHTSRKGGCLAPPLRMSCVGYLLLSPEVRAGEIKVSRMVQPGK